MPTLRPVASCSNRSDILPNSAWVSASETLCGAAASRAWTSRSTSPAKSSGRAGANAEAALAGSPGCGATSGEFVPAVMGCALPGRAGLPWSGSNTSAGASPDLPVSMADAAARDWAGLAAETARGRNDVGGRVSGAVALVSSAVTGAACKAAMNEIGGTGSTGAVSGEGGAEAGEVAGRV